MRRCFLGRLSYMFEKSVMSDFVFGWTHLPRHEVASQPKGEQANL